jgi:class 3 adenylate cyclase
VSKGRVRYCAPAANGAVPAFLVAGQGTPEETWCPIYDRLDIGRDDGAAPERPGSLLVADGTVSRSHCVLTRNLEGRWFVRDTSRNGTRLDGRRLVPNVEVEMRSGQTLSLGEREEFVLIFERAAGLPADADGGTLPVPSQAVVTVLVGDIRDYTVLVRLAPSHEVQQSVARVFRILTETVTGEGGTTKEFQGDALVAFWEGSLAGEQATAACRAAIRLDALVQQLAADASIWHVSSFPLRIDWALASGAVLIDSFGGYRPAGLSMIGEAPIMAFRLEKFATDETGRILVCPTTRAMASGSFRFRDLGLMTAKGFDRSDHVFALEGVLAQAPGAAAHRISV